MPGQGPGYVPRVPVNRDTPGFIKTVADADTGRIVGITTVAKDSGDLTAAGVYILEPGMTVEQVANLWSPYLTMAEGIKIAAQSYTTDVSKLSCCASSPLPAPHPNEHPLSTTNFIHTRRPPDLAGQQHRSRHPRCSRWMSSADAS